MADIIHLHGKDRETADVPAPVDPRGVIIEMLQRAIDQIKHGYEDGRRFKGAYLLLHVEHADSTAFQVNQDWANCSMLERIGMLKVAEADVLSDE